MLVDVVVTDEDGVQVTSSATVQIVKRSGCGCNSGATSTGSGLALALLLLGAIRRRRRVAWETDA